MGKYIRIIKEIDRAHKLIMESQDQDIIDFRNKNYPDSMQLLTLIKIQELIELLEGKR